MSDSATRPDMAELCLRALSKELAARGHPATLS
jgi:hypothetical protein